jgi:O-antigen/teichoic acid export membrane protein
MRSKRFASLISVFGAAQLTTIAFLVSGIRNVWLATAVGVEGLGANSLSSLLISLFAFSDLGAVLYLRKGASSHNALVGVTKLSLTLKKVSLFSSLVTCLLSLSAGLFLFTSQNYAYAIAFLAGAFVYPIQSAFIFRSTLHSVKGNQIRGSMGSLIASILNFVISIATIKFIGIWVIIIGPASGFFLALVAELILHSRDRMPYSEILKSRIRIVDVGVKREAFKLALSQFLALVISSSDLVLTIFLLGLGAAGEMSFVNNLVVVLAIFPIALSNSLNSKINVTSAQSRSETIDKLAVSQNLLLNVTAILTIVGTASYQLLVSKFLPDYSNSVGWVWILTTATYLYNATFYTSTLTIAMNSQNRVMKAQGIALASQLVFVISLILLNCVSIFTIAISAVVKMFIYLFLHSLEVHRLSAGVLPSPTRVIRTLLPQLSVFFACAYLQPAGQQNFLYLLVGMSLLAYSVQVPKDWKRFKQKFEL